MHTHTHAHSHKDLRAVCTPMPSCQNQFIGCCFSVFFFLLLFCFFPPLKFILCTSETFYLWLTSITRTYHKSKRLSVKVNGRRWRRNIGFRQISEVKLVSIRDRNNLCCRPHSLHWVTWASRETQGPQVGKNVLTTRKQSAVRCFRSLELEYKKKKKVLTKLRTRHRMWRQPYIP